MWLKLGLRSGRTLGNLRESGIGLGEMEGFVMGEREGRHSMRDCCCRHSDHQLQEACCLKGLDPIPSVYLWYILDH